MVKEIFQTILGNFDEIWLGTGAESKTLYTFEKKQINRNRIQRNIVNVVNNTQSILNEDQHFPLSYLLN